MDNLAITSIVHDPQNTMIFYASTGEAYTEVTPGLGLFKSIDGGTTWTPIATSQQFKYIAEIKIRVESGTSVIYLASHRNYVGDALGGATNFLGDRGLWRSADSGATWTQVMRKNNNGTIPDVDDIELDASGNLWASTGSNSAFHKGGNIYTCTTNCQDSTNWIKKFDAINNSITDVDRTVIAASPSNSKFLYAISGKDGAGNLDVAFFKKSIDGGTTWTDVTIPKNYDIQTCMASATDHFTRAQATYDLVMTVHPTDSNLVFVGGINMYRTKDGWASSSRFSAWYAGLAPCDKVLHADQHAIVFRPGFPNEVIFGNDGGVYYSANAGNPATDNTTVAYTHHVKNYNTTQCYAVDIAPTSGAAEYLTGLQDNGTQDFDMAGGSTTSEAVGGDGAFCHIDQNASGTQLGAYIYNDYTVTTDEWATKTQISPTPQTGRFINPSDYDDMNNILYAASNLDNLCKVTGVGAANMLIDGIPVGGAMLGGKIATTIRVDRNDPTTIYVGTDAGKILKIPSANTATLTSSDISTGLPTGWISSIDVELGNSMHMLATLSNYGVSSVWESTNGGTTWANLDNASLPDMPVRWGIFSPHNNDHVILATEMGIWSTDNIDGAATAWGVTNTGLAKVRTDMIKYRTSDKKLIVATHGRGVFIGGTGTPCPPVLTISDNPANGIYVAGDTINTSTLGPVQVTTTAIFDADKAINLNKLFEVAMGATFEVKLDGCN